MAYFDPGREQDELQRGLNAGASIANSAMANGGRSVGNQNPAAAELAAEQGLRAPLSDEHADSQALSPAQVGNAESAAAGAAGQSLWKPEDGEGLRKRVLGKALSIAETAEGAPRGGKKLLGGGVVGVVMALLATFGFVGIAEKEIVHIADVIKAYENKIVQHSERKEAAWLLTKIMQRAKNKAAAKAEAAANTDDPVIEEVDNFATEELPKFAPELDAQGYKITYDNAGNVTSFTDPAGIDLSKASSIPAADFGVIDAEALPQEGLSETMGERDVLAFDYNANLDPFPSDTDENKDKFKQDVANDVINGASAEQISGEAAGVSEEPPPDGTTPTAQQNADAQAVADQTGELSDALKAANSTMVKTGDAAAAVQAGVDAVDKDIKAGAKTGSVLFAANAACQLEQLAQKGADIRKVVIAERDIRQGALLLAVADQIRSGHITSGTVKLMTQLYKGNKNAKNPDDKKSYFQSATWTKATSKGPVVDGKYANDTDPSAIPLPNSSTNFIDTVQHYMNETGGALTCKALTSTWGTVVQYGMGIGQFLASLASFGLADAAVLAANGGFILLFDKVIVPQTISYFTGFSVSGTENALGQANVGGLGMNLGANAYMRSIGGVPLSTDQVKSLNQAANAENIAITKAQPWTYRTFALSNPFSLASTIMDSVPLSMTDAVSNTSSFITDIPSTMVHAFASLLNPRAVFADSQAVNAPDGDGTTQYSLPDVQQYDPVDNAVYMRGSGKDSKGANGSKYLVSVPTGSGTKQISRVAALGDPATYQDNPAGDSNYGDLMHCFVDSYSILASNSAGNPADQNCDDIGQIDITNPKLPGDQEIAQIYCNYAGNTDSSCPGSILSQLDGTQNGYGELYRYCQYLADTNIGAYFNLLPIPGVTNAAPKGSGS